MVFGTRNGMRATGYRQHEPVVTLLNAKQTFSDQRTHQTIKTMTGLFTGGRCFRDGDRVYILEVFGYHRNPKFFLLQVQLT